MQAWRISALIVTNIVRDTLLVVYCLLAVGHDNDGKPVRTLDTIVIYNSSASDRDAGLRWLGV